MCLIWRSEKRTRKVFCGGDHIRPVGFLLGLIFAFLSLLISFIGLFVWIVGKCNTCASTMLHGGIIPLSVPGFWPSPPLEFASKEKQILLLLLTCLCSGCGPTIVREARNMINAPVNVMEWFTAHIPF
ncbi:hypothetical protein C5167_040570 [Papaver somniferum]|uniref:Uncharacterized protein n=1 Tax=Papaver somniferum TaxID=3469 RepID=A0A4Y7IIU3_PAPSO|nr:hypothetical protein C5167_040570 [Papaver somniferum]